MIVIDEISWSYSENLVANVKKFTTYVWVLLNNI